MRDIGGETGRLVAMPVIIGDFDGLGIVGNQIILPETGRIMHIEMIGRRRKQIACFNCA